jgi:glycerol-3-phosphate dehydrogenase
VSRLAGLGREPFDAIIVGGGMAGAGVARDLALRGLSALLVDKGDFASGTTSRSSKLIHGGLRYLELFEFALVRESLRERETLARLAPQLVRPLPFLIPVYRGGTRSLIKIRIGLRLYDGLTPGKRTERSRTLTRGDALALEPGLRPEDLVGAGYYYDDLLLSPERLCLENLLAARRAGARALNYVQVEGIEPRPGGGWSVRIRDLVSGEGAGVVGRVVVNAAGPWVDRVRELARVADAGPRLLRTTKGSHVVLPRLSDRAIYLSTRDDRMVFVIPWREFSLVGTTDTDFEENPDRVWATADEVRYLLQATRGVLQDARITEANIAYTYAGVRPLTAPGDAAGRRASAVSRQHRVFVEGPDDGFLSITGTKLSCFRSLAQEVADRVGRRLGKRRPSRTATVALDGSDEEAGSLEVRAMLDVTEAVRATGLEPGQVEMLVGTYGRRARAVLDLARRMPSGTERLCKEAPEIAGQLRWAVETELAVSLQDVLLRRTGIGTGPCLGLDCAPAIAQRMGALCGWTARRLDAELDAYHAAVRQGLRFREG